MTYTISESDAIQIVKVNSLYNEFDNKKILNEVQTRIEKGFNKFVVDLETLDFMNSVGLNFLISVMTKSRKSGGDITLANANDQVLKLLHVTKLTPLFRMTSSVEDALNVFRSN